MQHITNTSTSPSICREMKASWMAASIIWLTSVTCGLQAHALTGIAAPATDAQSTSQSSTPSATPVQVYNADPVALQSPAQVQSPAPASGQQPVTGVVKTTHTTTPLPVVPHIQSIPSMRARKADAPLPTHKSSYTFTLDNISWQDTGVALVAGEQISLTADGKFTLDDSRITTPAGLPRGWRDLLRQFPLNSADSAALIGRVSDNAGAVPFLIGEKADLTVPTSGHLFLRINLGSDMTATGSYKVKLKFPRMNSQPEATPSKGATVPVPDVNSLVTVQTFDTIPRRVSDKQGHPGDMVNFALIGTREQVAATFKNAGWVPADKTIDDAVAHGIMDTIARAVYLEMPMSTLYLFGRPQDFAFVRADALTVAAVRHHLRVWKTAQTINGEPLWVGSSTHDDGFEKDQRTGGVTHHIDPDIDEERDFILHSFDSTAGFSSAAYVLPNNPFSSGKTATGGNFHSDGRILVMYLK